MITIIVRFTIPGEAVGKGRPRMSVVNGRGRMYTPGKTAQYEQLVKLAASEAMGGQSPTDQPVHLGIWVYLPIPQSASKKARDAMLESRVHPAKKPDLDNCIKSVMDGLNQVAFLDDKQIVSIHAGKHYSDKPRVEVEIYTQEHMGV